MAVARVKIKMVECTLIYNERWSFQTLRRAVIKNAEDLLARRIIEASNSVTKRCTCLFDIEKAPAPPASADPSKPDYVTKTNGGNGPIAGTSGTPGANCYRFGVS